MCRSPEAQNTTTFFWTVPISQVEYRFYYPPNPVRLNWVTDQLFAQKIRFLRKLVVSIQMAEVKLFCWKFCPYAQRAWISAQISRIEYEYKVMIEITVFDSKNFSRSWTRMKIEKTRIGARSVRREKKGWQSLYAKLWLKLTLGLKQQFYKLL